LELWVSVFKELEETSNSFYIFQWNLENSAFVVGVLALDRLSRHKLARFKQEIEVLPNVLER
jgi:hypothetical protein